MTPQERQQLKEVYEFIQNLKRSSTIPLAFDQAFRKRFGIGDAVLKRSTIASTTYDQAVNEAGSATYAVFDTPDGFLEYVDASQTLYIPFRT